MNRIIDDPYGLAEKYPSLFAKTENLSLAFPKGWLPLVDKILKGYAAAGLSAHITRFGLRDQSLVLKFSRDEKYDSFCELLVKLLAQTSRYCPFCGKLLNDANPLNGYERLPICENCLEEMGLDPEKCGFVESNSDFDNEDDDDELDNDFIKW